MSGEPTNPKHPAGKQPTLMRSIGRFFGHITHAVKTPAPSAEREEIARETREAHTTDEHGRRVILRRTTIDEVEIEPGSNEPRP